MPDGPEMESTPCPQGCAGADESVLSGGDRLHGLPGQFNVVRCRTCGLMRTDPRPTASAMATYYPDSYEPYQSSQVGAGRRKGMLGRLAHAALETNATRLPDLRPGRMLEVGCASGSFLAGMRDRGWLVQGIEPGESPAASAMSAGLDVHVGTVQSAPAPSEPLDLIVGWMVLEHLHQPVADLQRLATWIRSDGWLVLSVPNAASWEFRRFRDSWYALQLPTHLSHFTPTTVTALLARGGWEVARIWHQRNIKNITASCGYWAADRGHSKLAAALHSLPVNAGPLRVVCYPLALALAGLRQSGRLTIWARPMPTCEDSAL